MINNNKMIKICLMLVHFIQLVAAGTEAAGKETTGKEAAGGRSTMPVFLIDNEDVFRGRYNALTNPFHKVTTQAFTEMIRSAVHRSNSVIIFVEETFSLEDVSARDKHGSAFYHLHRGLVDMKVKFMPTVYEPFKTLVAIFPPLTANVFYLIDNLRDFHGMLKYYYVFFQDDNNETRVERLRRHDKIMRTAFFAVRQKSSGPLVAFYTGKVNPMAPMGSVSYLPPQPPVPAEPAEPASVMIVTDGALFKLSGMYSISGPLTMKLMAPAAADQVTSPRSMLTRMLYNDFELEFEFSYHPEEWTLEAVSMLEGGEVVGRTHMGARAPWDWSFYCAEPITIMNDRDGSIVVVSQYQVEPLYKSYLAEMDVEAVAAGEDYRLRSKDDFDNTINCGPYFSAVILTGLTVVFVLLMILMYGVLSLMNCQANSLFDDVNQKPLVIVAQL